MGRKWQETENPVHYLEIGFEMHRDTDSLLRKHKLLFTTKQYADSAQNQQLIKFPAVVDALGHGFIPTLSTL